MNKLGQEWVEEILTHPSSTFTYVQTKHYGNILDVKIPHAAGLRFSLDEVKFMGLLEP